MVVIKSYFKARRLTPLRANLQLSGKVGRPEQLVFRDLWFGCINVEYNLCVCHCLIVGM